MTPAAMTHRQSFRRHTVQDCPRNVSTLYHNTRTFWQASWLPSFQIVQQCGSRDFVNIRPCPWTRLQMFPGFGVRRKKDGGSEREREEEWVGKVGGLKKTSPFLSDSYFPVCSSKGFWLQPPRTRVPQEHMGHCFNMEHPLRDEVLTAGTGKLKQGTPGSCWCQCAPLC